MSTRSGKRIHASEDSPIVDTNINLQSERKTRSKKQKENFELSVKKRHCYVKYPAEEDTASVSSDATEPREDRARRTRRNTLKDHNHVLGSDGPQSTSVAETVRKSRRGKKNIEERENTVDIDIRVPDKTDLNGNNKKKNKKKKNYNILETNNIQDTESQVIKKKGTKKKKKRSNSFVVNDQLVQSFHGTCDTSADSFHSAAGSPVRYKVIKSNDQAEVLNNSTEREVELNTLSSITTPADDLHPVDTNVDTAVKKRCSIKNSTFEKVEIESVDKRNFISTFGKSPVAVTSGDTTLELVTKKKRKSNVKNSTLDEIEIGGGKEYINSSFDKSPLVTANNTTLKIASKKKSKSCIKNSTFDQTEMEGVDNENLNSTYDKSPIVVTANNSTLGLAIKNTRKSSIRNSTFDKMEIEGTDNENLNSTYDKSPIVVTANNSTLGLAIRNTRKSSIRKSTFDKTEIAGTDKENLNSTYDKSPLIVTANNSTLGLAIKNTRKSSIRNSTCDKTEIEGTDKENLNSTYDKSPLVTTTNPALDFAAKNKKKHTTKHSTFDKIDTSHANNDNVDVAFEKTVDTPDASDTTINISLRIGKRKSIKGCNTDNIESNVVNEGNLNTTFDKIADIKSLNSSVDVSIRKRNKTDITSSTIDSIEINKTKTIADNLNLTINNIFDTTGIPNGISPMNNEKLNTSKKLLGPRDTASFNESPDSKVLNSTNHKTSNRRRKSNAINSSFDKIENNLKDNEGKDAISTFNKDDKSLQMKKNPQGDNIPNERRQTLNGVIERASKSTSGTNNRISTYNKDMDLNTTFETEKHSHEGLDSKKSSLISSDASSNVTFDKSGDNSHISITSDESRSEHIFNQTPVLIESSANESLISEDRTPEPKVLTTPLKREGTFTKEVDDVIASPKLKATVDKTPVKRKSSPGCTPFPNSRSSQKNTVLNVTRSIEKSPRRSTLAEAAPRQTRVMFCSPVNNAAIVTQLKGRVIKSNLKGSNKSFVFEDTASAEVRPARRKRSLTLGDDTLAKRSRLGDGLQRSVDRRARPRTLSAAAKPPEPGSPCRAKPEGRVLRTKLPNFAALHLKQFAKMESLDECQARRARRARQLLTPTGCVAMLDRISPKGETPPKAPAAKEPPAKQRTPSKARQLTLESLNPGYTRFGFKLNVEANPFTATRNPDAKVSISRKTTCLALPSLAGATLGRREVAKQTVMREKSFSGRDVKREESRTVIKGVRTNRRFELQMKHRNVNA